MGFVAKCPKGCIDHRTNQVYQAFVCEGFDIKEDIKVCFFCGTIMYIPPHLKKENKDNIYHLYNEEVVENF